MEIIFENETERGLSKCDASATDFYSTLLVGERVKLHALPRQRKGFYTFTNTRDWDFGNQATINHFLKRITYTVTGPLQFYIYDIYKRLTCHLW